MSGETLLISEQISTRVVLSLCENILNIAAINPDRQLEELKSVKNLGLERAISWSYTFHMTVKDIFSYVNLVEFFSTKTFILD